MGGRSQRQPENNWLAQRQPHDARHLRLLQVILHKPTAILHVSGAPGAVAAAMELHKTKSAVLGPDEKNFVVARH